MGHPNYLEFRYTMPSLNDREGNFTMVRRHRRGLATELGMEVIGERLARLRQERGISQQELAKQLGIAQPNVSDYERGIMRLHGELIVKLTEILSVSADELLGLSNGTPKTGPTPKLHHQLQQVNQLPRAKQKFISEMLTGLLQQASR
jgi:transcriptional regulator with XRE-family HTH domain